MKKNFCRVRFFEIDRGEGPEGRREIWVETVRKGKKNLFRLRPRSGTRYFLLEEVFGGTVSPERRLVDYILKRALDRKVIPEGGKLIWAGDAKES